MFCGHCGLETGQGAPACIFCGAAMSAVRTAPASGARTPARVPGITYAGSLPHAGGTGRSPAPKLPAWRIRVIAMALTACVGLAACFSLFSVHTAQEDYRCLFGLYSPQDNRTYLYIGGELVLTVEGYQNCLHDIPETQEYFVAGSRASDSLFRCDANGMRLITDRCESLSYNQTRETAAYISEGTLFLYSAVTDETVKICDDEFGDIQTVFSDDGASLLYDNSEGIFLYRQGKAVRLSDEPDTLLLSLTDDGTALVITQDHELVRFRDGVRTVVSNNFSVMEYFLFNEAGDQFIFETADGVCYFVHGTADPVKIDDSFAQLDLYLVRVSDGDNLTDAAYCNMFTGEIYYVSGDGSSVSAIGKTADYSRIFAREGGMIYNCDGALYEASGSGFTDIKTLVSGMRDNVWVTDGEATYFAGATDGLFYFQISKGIATRVCDDEILYMDMMPDGTLLFIDSDGNLFSCKAGKDVTLIDSGVETILTAKSAAFYYKNKRTAGNYEVYDVYMITDGAAFTLLAEGAAMFDTFS